MKRLLLVVITLTLLVGSSALQGQTKNFTLVWDGGIGDSGSNPPNLVRAWGMIGTIPSGSIDIDGDGKNEFITYDATNKRIFVYESDGDDSYAVVWHKDKDVSGTSILLGSERSVMITDLDEDGNLELINIWDSFHPDSTLANSSLTGFNALEIYEHDPSSGEILPDTPTLT
ncbi:MAG: hypothetical protein IIB42_09435, partial [Candidatus Marinimicrobia bacterium]|nr:hypothetical protein [Candidatus Neomarinimicrobiota bacterium]